MYRWCFIISMYICVPRIPNIRLLRKYFDPLKSLQTSLWMELLEPLGCLCMLYSHLPRPSSRGYLESFYLLPTNSKAKTNTWNHHKSLTPLLQDFLTKNSLQTEASCLDLFNTVPKNETQTNGDRLRWPRLPGPRSDLWWSRGLPAEEGHGFGRAEGCCAGDPKLSLSKRQNMTSLRVLG